MLPIVKQKGKVLSLGQPFPHELTSLTRTQVMSGAHSDAKAKSAVAKATISASAFLSEAAKEFSLAFVAGDVKLRR